MFKASAGSKSFIVLFVIALFGTFLCLNLSLQMLTNTPYNEVTYSATQTTPGYRNAAQASPVQPVDTSSWKTYTNKQYNFSFKYPTDWKVLSITQQTGYNVLQIDPGAKFYNIKIYISTQGYYIMGGLPLAPDKIGGQRASNVNNLLYGVMDGNYYYTFDIGLSTSLKPDFDALVHSVTFGS